jgi:Protein of unknown function (DUF1804)
MGHSSETRQEAFELYVYQGQSLETIALKLCVPIGTLKRWSSDGKESADKKSWKILKEEIDRDKASLAARLYRAAAKMMDKAVKTNNPQELYAAINAFNALENHDPEKDELQKELARVKLEKEKISLDKLKKAADAVVKTAEEAAGRDLTPEQIKTIREQVYGIYDD